MKVGDLVRHKYAGSPPSIRSQGIIVNAKRNDPPGYPVLLDVIWLLCDGTAPQTIEPQYLEVISEGG